VAAGRRRRHLRRVPEWYATLFSGFYLPLLLILVALILRGVAFEYRGKRDDAAWRRRWDWRIIGGSLVPGAAVGRRVRQHRPRRAARRDHEYVGGFFDLLNPYALLGGLTTLTLFTCTARCSWPSRPTARCASGPAASRPARRPVVVIAGGSCSGPPSPTTTSWAGPVGASPRSRWSARGRHPAAPGGLGVPGHRRHHRAGHGRAVRHALPGRDAVDHRRREQPHHHNASSTPYTLKVMTWVAVAFTPIVLAYQGWTYWVFRKRLTVEHIPDPPPGRRCEAARPAAAAVRPPGPGVPGGHRGARRRPRRPDRRPGDPARVRDHRGVPARRRSPS
jgi:cytochrome d ubiquinol oxidase subunit II